MTDNKDEEQKPTRAQLEAAFPGRAFMDGEVSEDQLAAAYPEVQRPKATGQLRLDGGECPDDVDLEPLGGREGRAATASATPQNRSSAAKIGPSRIPKGVN